MSIARTTLNVEEPVLSLSKQKQIKLKEFREYLVDKNVLLGYVKCKFSFVILSEISSFIGIKIFTKLA